MRPGIVSILILSGWPRPDSQTEQALLMQQLLNVWHKPPQTQSYVQVTWLSISTPTAGLGQDQAEMALLWVRMKGGPTRLPDIWGPGVCVCVGGVTVEFHQTAICSKGYFGPSVDS